MRIGPGRRSPHGQGRPTGRGGGVHARRSRGQPGGARRHRGGVPGPTADGPGPLSRLAAHLDRGRPAVVAPGPRRLGGASSQPPRERRAALAGVHVCRAARRLRGGWLAGRRCGGGGGAAGGRATVRAAGGRGPPSAGRAVPRRAGRAARDLLGGRRVRRREPAGVLAERTTGVPRRRPGGRCQAGRDAVRCLRASVRVPFRAAHVRRRHGLRPPRRSDSSMTDERTRGLLLVLLGVTAAWLCLTDAALNYVRPSLVPYVLAGAVVLMLLGLLPPLGLLHRRSSGRGDGDGHGHGSTRVGRLLLVPVLVVVLVQPAALGSYAASSRAAVPGGSDGIFPPLAPPVRGAVPMIITEFVMRALHDPSRSLEGVPVRLVGFVAPGEGEEAYRLTRFVIFCCAADAEALQVVVRGDGTRWRRDQWLEVEGRWLPRPVAGAEDPGPPPPVLIADVVHPIAQPRRPYESSAEYGG